MVDPKVAFRTPVAHIRGIRRDKTLPPTVPLQQREILQRQPSTHTRDCAHRTTAHIFSQTPASMPMPQTPETRGDDRRARAYKRRQPSWQYRRRPSQSPGDTDRRTPSSQDKPPGLQGRSHAVSRLHESLRQQHGESVDRSQLQVSSKLARLHNYEQKLPEWSRDAQWHTWARVHQGSQVTQGQIRGKVHHLWALGTVPPQHGCLCEFADELRTC